LSSQNDIQPAVVDYPILNLSAPSIPARSRLFPLPPIGIGTPYVESLTSYMCRLTVEHSLSFGSFYEYLLVPTLNKAYLASPSHLGPASTLVGSFRNRMKNINGIGKLAQELIGMLEGLTLRNDLRHLCLTALSNAIPHWKLLRTFQAWCPACYEEMLQTQQIIYQPIVWTMAAVDICARHCRPLVAHCPYCHRQLLPLNRRAQIGYCAHCGYWLGERLNDRTRGEVLLEEEKICLATICCK
jgi:TniQ